MRTINLLIKKYREKDNISRCKEMKLRNRLRSLGITRKNDRKHLIFDKNDFSPTYHQSILQLICLYLQVIIYTGKLMQDQNSGMFKVDASKQVQVREMHFFNKNTQIIKEGQRHKVVFGQMEEQKKSLHEIVTPYLQRFATTTAEIASKAGSTTYQALKNGFLWVYDKFVNNVIPYAIQTLPKIIFVTKKQENGDHQNSAAIQVMLDEDDFNKISKENKKQGKTRVVVPLGTENDKHFQEFLRNENYEIQDYSFPIDVDSEEIQVKESFMIPSQSFEVICQGVKESHIQLQMQQPPIYKKVAYKLDKCFMFELQGKNTIEYDMLDSIQKAKETKVGYIVAPEQSLRRSVSDDESNYDPIAQLVNGKEPTKHVEMEEDKEVDMQRNVRVEINNRKPRPEYDLALN